MATAGYSGTPLLKKLGIKENMKVRLIQAPANYMDLLEVDIQGQVVGKKTFPISFTCLHPAKSNSNQKCTN
ncbi:hypothetical protein [Paraflavitalea speifideaquila]|uniref:hypothetical protein n=1 Tax=Paraflavitalea speifideaquila TaxID=3076558 RepID=UPI0028E23BC0|nr:hypothetical protein [Paraflavitalea speifideiaquila]